MFKKAFNHSIVFASLSFWLIVLLGASILSLIPSIAVLTDYSAELLYPLAVAIAYEVFNSITQKRHSKAAIINCMICVVFFICAVLFHLILMFYGVLRHLNLIYLVGLILSIAVAIYCLSDAIKIHRSSSQELQNLSSDPSRRF